MTFYVNVMDLVGLGVFAMSIAGLLAILGFQAIGERLRRRRRTRQ